MKLLISETLSFIHYDSPLTRQNINSTIYFPRETGKNRLHPFSSPQCCPQTPPLTPQRAKGQAGISHGLSPSSPPLRRPPALDLLQTAIEKAGFTDKVVVGMDVAASEFYRDGKYDLDFKSPPDAERHISAEELADIYQGFVNNYPGS